MEPTSPESLLLKASDVILSFDGVNISSSEPQSRECRTCEQRGGSGVSRTIHYASRLRRWWRWSRRRSSTCSRTIAPYSSEQEKLYRLSVVEQNLAFFITQHNDLGNCTYKLSLNSFADLADQF